MEEDEGRRGEVTGEKVKGEVTRYTEMSYVSTNTEVPRISFDDVIRVIGSMGFDN